MGVCNCTQSFVRTGLDISTPNGPAMCALESYPQLSASTLAAQPNIAGRHSAVLATTTKRTARSVTASNGLIWPFWSNNQERMMRCHTKAYSKQLISRNQLSSRNRPALGVSTSKECLASVRVLISRGYFRQSIQRITLCVRACLDNVLYPPVHLLLQI
jgi:hypothetical protein